MPAHGYATERPPAVTSARPPPPRRAPWVGAEPPRGQVVLGAGLVLVLAATIEGAVRGHLGWFTGVFLVLVSVGAALLMRRTDLFTAGVLPPLLTLALLFVVALVHPSAVSVSALDPTASAVQVVIAGFVDLAGALVVAHVLALLLVGLRVRAAHLRTAPR